VNSFYFDTSALIKRYLDETGSRWVRELFTTLPGPLVLTSHLTAVEGVCTLARRHRDRLLVSSDYHQLLVALAHDMQYEYQVIGVDKQVIDVAWRLADTHPLRAYDAVQLASAWQANHRLVSSEQPPLTFVCADARLLEIARAEGLRTENPNDHG
jgi:predicted nucleic acid-binding protein